MVYYVRRGYRQEKPVMYNNIGTKELYGAFVNPEGITTIGGEKKVIEGSFLTPGGGVLARAQTIGRYKGDGKIYVNNPYPFKPGDSLRVIGKFKPDLISEYDAVVRSTAPTLGTVTRVAGDLVKEVLKLTPTSLVPGNIISLWIDWIPVTYPVTSANVAETVNGLKKAISSIRGTFSTLDEIELNATETALEVSAKESGEIFSVWGQIDKGSAGSEGSLQIEVVQGVGCIEFIPEPGAPSSLLAGSRVGTITDVPLGVIAHAYYLGDSAGGDRPRDVAAYSDGMVNRCALPYLDGHLVQAIPGLIYMPHYLDN